MKKLAEIKKSLPVMIPSGAVYAASAYMIPNMNGAGKAAMYLLFLAAFAVFGGSIINLMDLKYIGKGFLK